jgi:uncharacterized protein (TIGR02646 family)
MRTIKKGREPKSWTEHRNTPGTAYDGRFGAAPSREARMDLRQALVSEQGFLCCYCMSRIEPDERMKVEHWVPQSGDRDCDLDYRNLLGACRGGEGEVPWLQHCDTAKGNQRLSFHPARDDVSRLFTYRADGAIVATDPKAEDDLHILRLNDIETLKRNRRAAMFAVHAWLDRSENKGRSLSRAEILKRARLLEERKAGHLDPYVDVTVSELHRLARKRPP